MLLCDWWILVNAYPHHDDVKQCFDNIYVEFLMNGSGDCSSSRRKLRGQENLQRTSPGQNEYHRHLEQPPILENILGGRVATYASIPTLATT